MYESIDDLRKTCFEIIERRFPKRGKILLLSLTGSRAFGWTAPNFDYDVHGIFICDEYWEWLHSGIKAIDLSLWDLEHVSRDVEYQYFETFQNLSNPIFVHPAFDHANMIGFCTVMSCDEHAIKFQYKQLDAFENPRTALHCYRIPLVMLHWLKYGEFELNIFKINEEYGCEMLELCRDHYTYHKQVEINYNKVRKELDYLLREVQKEKKRCERKTFDREKFEEWKNRMLAI